MTNFKLNIFDMLDEKLLPLKNVPNSKNFVNIRDFSRFTQKFVELEEKVETASSVLADGYKIHKDHVMHAKISRTEAEDLVNAKFDA